MEDRVVELWKGGDPESSESGGHTQTDEQLTLPWNNNITGSTSNTPHRKWTFCPCLTPGLAMRSQEVHWYARNCG